MNPIVSVLLRYVLGPLLIGIGAFFYGQHVGEAECQASQIKKQDKQTQVADQHLTTAQTQDAVGATKEIDRETTVREINNTVPQIIDHDVPVYSSTCLDADGVRALNSAAAVASGGSPASGPVDLTAAVQPPAGQH